MTTPTTPPTPDRLREILKLWIEHEDITFELMRDLLALLADERRDAGEEMRVRCEIRVINAGHHNAGEVIRALSDEENP